MGAHVLAWEAGLAGPTGGTPGLDRGRSDVREAKLMHVVPATRPHCIVGVIHHRAAAHAARPRRSDGPRFSADSLACAVM
eukprot:7110967-Lingulodinium_polyedra.AAC.1